MKKVKFKIKKFDAVIPTKGSKEAAGHDLYACVDNEISISPHETVLIDTGIAVALPKNTFGAIFARSGLATKEGLAPANKVGVIDSDYRGNIKVALHNHSNMSRVVRNGDRIAQLVVIPYVPVKIIVTDDLGDTDRGEGGFGSTGQ